MAKPTRGIKITTDCAHCKGSFKARLTDIRCGWGLYCSKACKAQAQADKQRAQSTPPAENNEP